MFPMHLLKFKRERNVQQAADITTHEQIEILFSNYTWVRGRHEMSVEEYNHVKHWIDPYTKARPPTQNMNCL
jgi:hypothetical protein